MVSRLNVASSKRLSSVIVFYTTLNMRVLTVLYRNGVIRGFSAKDKRGIMVYLKYYQMRPVFRKLRVVSTPGCRVYWKLSKLSLTHNYNNFSTFYIISSPKGLITSNDALLGMGISGEILLQVTI